MSAGTYSWSTQPPAKSCAYLYPRPWPNDSFAPKSNAAARAIGAARAHVREHGAQAPPAYLRSAGHALAAAALGHGRGYDYPHDRPGHVSDQELLPEGLAGERFYAPDDAEAALRERLEAIRRARGR